MSAYLKLVAGGGPLATCEKKCASSFFPLFSNNDNINHKKTPDRR